MPIRLNELAQFLNHFFKIQDFRDEEKNCVYQPSTRLIQRLGLALEPSLQLLEWVSTKRLDALFLHRPWKLEPEQLPFDIGVLTYHLAFDERLTLSFNLRLAEALSMSDIQVLGEKEGRPIGMIGEIPAQSFASYCTTVDEIFGGQEEARAGVRCEEVVRVAVVGAMTDALVREAALLGADVYITGQWRQPATTAVLETGMGVIIVGHRRCEEWGLRALAGVLRERWFKLEVLLFED